MVPIMHRLDSIATVSDWEKDGDILFSLIVSVVPSYYKETLILEIIVFKSALESIRLTVKCKLTQS